MAGVHAITVDADDEARARDAIDAAIADVLRIEAKYSRYRDDSVTTAINRAAGRHEVAIDAETSALLRYADQCHALSGGPVRHHVRRAAPRVGLPARAAARSGRRADRRVARADRLAARAVERDAPCALPSPAWSSTSAASARNTRRIARRRSCRSAASRIALVNLGGDVRAIGGQANGTPWHIGIRHPREPEPAVIASVDVTEGAIATSGDYERYFEHAGRRYCHLLDALTGMPVCAWQSMSVAAPLAVVAGSCSTIAMLLEEGAIPFLEAQGVAWLGVDARGTLRGTLAR